MNILSLVFLSVLLTACAGHSYKHPSLSGNPQAMSSDTLCYRHATRPSDEALAAEVAARHLDCGAALAHDPLYMDRRY